jgi:hypothetical protein
MKIAFGIVSALFVLATVTSALAQSLPGKYNVEVKNLDGSAYSGAAEIIATSETTCRIRSETGGRRQEASACATAAPSRQATSWAIQSA